MANIVTRPLSNDEILTLTMKSRQPWKSIYFLAVYTGLRISDLVRIPYVDRPNSNYFFEKKTRKTKRIEWSEVALSYWKALYHWGLPRKKLFPFSEISTYRKHIQRDCSRLSISSGRVAFHSLRKSHAVIAYRSGGIAAAKIAMNHSSERTTTAYIERALQCDVYSAYDRLFTPAEATDE